MQPAPPPDPLPTFALTPGAFAGEGSHPPEAAPAHPSSVGPPLALGFPPPPPPFNPGAAPPEYPPPPPPPAT